MPTPAETSPPPHTEFDPLAFWIEHKRKIQFLAALLVVGLVSYGVFELSRRRAREAAARDYAAAQTAEDFRGVAQRHPRSVVAANAHLMLAERLRTEGKHGEAITTLRAFIDKHSEHPLISGAWTSLAFTLEAEGKEDEALSTLQKTAATYPTSFSAPLALMAQARIYKKRGEIEQAKRVYEQVVSQFGQSNFGREALMELQRLKKPDPAPAVPATPAALPDAAASPGAAETKVTPATTPEKAAEKTAPVPAAPAPVAPPASTQPPASPPPAPPVPSARP